MNPLRVRRNGIKLANALRSRSRVVNLKAFFAGSALVKHPENILHTMTRSCLVACFSLAAGIQAWLRQVMNEVMENGYGYILFETIL